MATSADLVQIAIVPEAVYGVTPSSPAFLVVRTTGESLAFAPTSTTSSEMNPKRQVTDTILTGGQSTGDLNFELAYEDWFELLLAGAYCKDWAVDTAKIGTTLLSFTVEKKIPVTGGFEYHRFTGCLVNGFTLNIRPNQPITGSFAMIGKTVTPGSTALSGATYTQPALTPVMNAPNVVGIEIDGVPAVSQCFNNLQLTLNNNNRAIECIGTLGPKEMALGRAEVQAQFSVLFSSSDLLNTLLTQDELSLEFTTKDADLPANYYTWLLPRVKFTANPIVAGGTNQDVVNAVTAQGLYDATAATTLQTVRGSESGSGT